ncbi:MAG: serine hydrolase [Marinoscillum sp.]|uniref:serine hydrolase n=1 Tax=Marinoscillum sp. TaxID=2024838 RepID=UPI0032FF4C17
MVLDKRIYSLIIFCLALTQCSPVQETSLFQANLDIPALKSFTQSVTQTYPLPGMAVVVVTRDTAYYLTTGYSDVIRKRPFTDSTVFFAGGFSELLVASTALRLQETNRLSLQDPVVKELPYFQMQGDYQRITLHHLLTHTSGVPHFNPAWDMPAYDEGALEATTRSIIFQDVLFAPGSQCKRSPYNYDILADLMAKSEKKSFEEVIHTEMLEPLGMTHSTFFPDTTSVTMARPHEVLNWLSYDLRASEIYPYTRENAGSFGLHTTVGDMAKWMQMALRTPGAPQGLSSASIDQLLTTHYKTAEHLYKGYGWEIVDAEGARIYNNSWHAGGFSGDMILIPSKEIGVMVLSNTSDDFNPGVISGHLIDHLQGGSLSAVKYPIHLAMSRKLTEGRCLEEVLAWHDSLVVAGSEDFLMGPSLLGQLGVNLMHRLSRMEDATVVFLHCVQLYPDAPEAHLNLAEALLASGLIEEAKTHFDEAMALRPAMNSPYVGFLREQLAVAQENQASS